MNFPDIALLEPLAELLELNVSELLAGEQDVPPREELVRDSLRVGLVQLGSRVRKWRGLFGVVLALLLILTLVFGYWFLKQYTDLLPQRQTVVSHQNARVFEELARRSSGGTAFSFFDVTWADDLECIQVQAELWTEDGKVRSWPLAALVRDGVHPVSLSNGKSWPTAVSQMLTDSSYPRHDTLAVSWQYSADRLEVGLSFLDCTWSGGSIDTPYLKNGFEFTVLGRSTAVSSENGVILGCYALTTAETGQLGDGQSPSFPSGPVGDLDAPSVEEGDALLLLRLICK